MLDVCSSAFPYVTTKYSSMMGHGLLSIVGYIAFKDCFDVSMLVNVTYLI